MVARQASRTNGHWLFEDVEIYRYEPGIDFEKLLKAREIGLPEALRPARRCAVIRLLRRIRV